MPDVSLILAALLAVLVFFFVLFKPLFMVKQAPYFHLENREGHFSEALSILEMITELETDFQMGKVSTADYEALSLDYKHRYLSAKAGESA